MGQRPKVNTASIFYDQKCTSLKFRKKKKKKKFFYTNLQQFRELNCLREHWSLEWTVDFPEQGKNLVN